MKALLLMIGAVIIILLMPAVLLSVNDFLMDEYEASYIVTTGANATSTDITLTQELYDDQTYNAVVTSNITADAPVPSSYVSSTQVLTVTGLDADNSRTLTVTYQIDALELFFASGVTARAWMLLLALGVIGIIVAAVYNAVRRDG